MLCVYVLACAVSVDLFAHCPVHVCAGAAAARPSKRGDELPGWRGQLVACGMAECAAAARASTAGGCQQPGVCVCWLELSIISAFVTRVALQQQHSYQEHTRGNSAGPSETKLTRGNSADPSETKLTRGNSADPETEHKRQLCRSF
eukprot:scaffold228545_cov22-Tisochrysis_lutea.AAC.2